ncbi:hypothetical protein DFH06DRAFT_1328337 [Mycena polygramma]|nr:hypothetical protein DFH06DRAFT_1328337 [Mycena polygramma]
MASDCEQSSHANVDDPSFPPAAFPETKTGPAQLRAAFEAVNREILRQPTHLSELEAQRHILELKLGQIVYPVLSLPPEIITQIFIECLPPHGRVRPSPIAPPLSLAQTCGVWREIALDTRELWRSVDVAFTKDFYPNVKKHVPNNGALPTMEMWFSRAKGQPLSLTVRSMHNELPMPIITLIASVAAQIQTLELTGSSRDFDILVQHEVAFPRLQRLAAVSRLEHHSLSLLQRAPLLVDLRLKAAPPSLSLLSPSLTILNIRQRMEFSTLLDIFQQCPCLSDLTVRVYSPNHWEYPLPLILPHLRSLVINGTGLDFLTLPALRHLDLSYNSTLCAFIERSRCILEHLAIVLDEGDAESRLLEILEAVPSLTSLTIDTQRYLDSFAQVLERYPALLPQLTTLRISGEYSDFDYITFIQLLRERRASLAGRARLTSVQLNLRSEYEFGENGWLPRSATTEFEKLVAQGLKVQVTCVDSSGCHVWPRGSSDPCKSFP